MRDIDTLRTKRGTPVIWLITRVAFIGYFLFALWSLQSQYFPDSSLSIPWVLYLIALYVVAEYLWELFRSRGIDLTFAGPLLFATYCLNLVTLLLGGQEKLPLLNRAEHFAIFVLISYVVWIFFTKYLPQNVWQKHPYYTAILVLSVTSLAGVGNELVELLLDQLYDIRLVGGQYDTSLDLLMNTLGSGLLLAVRLILREGGILDEPDRT